MTIKTKLLTMVFVCAAVDLHAQKPSHRAAATTVQFAAPKYGKLSYLLIKSPDNTFGYNIFQNGTLLIHQPNIPAVQGNKGFATRSKATKVAKLVIEKIKKGEMPPTVTVAELKKLGAIR